MMLLYLSSNQNIGIFDSVAKEQGILVKKLSGEFHFKSFVIRDMRSLNHYEYVAIDLKAIKDTEEFIEAIIAFKSMYDSRIIIYSEGLKQGNVLLNKLVDIEVYNLITSTKIETINQEIKKTFQELRCFPAIKTIASDCNMSKRTVQSGLSTLFKTFDVRGEYLKIFDEEYEKIIQEEEYQKLFEKYSDLFPRYKDVLAVREGYFARDKKNNVVDVDDWDPEVGEAKLKKKFQEDIDRGINLILEKKR
jgi:hypothetical protein